MEAPKTNSPAETKLHFLDYWRIIRIRKTVILAVFLLVVLTTTAVTFILPESYASTVRIAVEKDTSDIMPLMGYPTSAQYDPYFIQTEFEKIRSKKVLYTVIEELDLNNKWKDRYGSGVPLKNTESFGILSQLIDVRQTRNTTLIEIRVYSDAKEKPAEEAALIANTIAKVYKDTRLEWRQEMSKKGIEKLEEQRLKQDSKVKEAQAEVDKWKKRLNISDIGQEGTGMAFTPEPEAVRRMDGERIAVQASYKGMVELLNQLKGLREKGGNELKKAILNANYDPQLAKLMENLWDTETTLAKLKQSLGPEHPEFKSVAAMQADLSTKVNERIEGMLSGFEIKVAASKAQLDSLAEEVENAKRKDAETTATNRPYFLAKRELDNLQKVRDAVILRIYQETVDAALPKTAIVEIIDKAEPGLRPV